MCLWHFALSLFFNAALFSILKSYIYVDLCIFFKYNSTNINTGWKKMCVTHFSKVQTK